MQVGRLTLFVVLLKIYIMWWGGVKHHPFLLKKRFIKKFLNTQNHREKTFQISHKNQNLGVFGGNFWGLRADIRLK